MYEYKAIVNRVIDGDTIHVNIDIGFNCSYSTSIRLYGINAPETKGAEKAKGLKSKAALKKMIEGKEITILTLKDKKEKYGRYLGMVYFWDGKKVIDINNWLVESNNALKIKY